MAHSRQSSENARTCGGRHTITAPMQRGLKFTPMSVLADKNLRDASLFGSDGVIYRGAVAVDENGQEIQKTAILITEKETLVLTNNAGREKRRSKTIGDDLKKPQKTGPTYITIPVDPEDLQKRGMAVHRVASFRIPQQGLCSRQEWMFPDRKRGRVKEASLERRVVPESVTQPKKSEQSMEKEPDPATPTQSEQAYSSKKQETSQQNQENNDVASNVESELSEEKKQESNEEALQNPEPEGTSESTPTEQSKEEVQRQEVLMPESSDTDAVESTNDTAADTHESSDVETAESTNDTAADTPESSDVETTKSTADPVADAPEPSDIETDQNTVIPVADASETPETDQNTVNPVADAPETPEQVAQTVSDEGKSSDETPQPVSETEQ